jgi:hypothetical protein
MEVSGDQLLLHVDEAGAKYPLQIDPFVQQAQLSASDSAQADSFGTTIAVDGDTVVVGASGSNSNQGAAYVFVKPSGGWNGPLHESAKLTASDGAPNSYFGSVAISGDTIVVGAYWANVGNNTLQGAAYVFVKPAAGWSGSLNENAKLTASDGRQGDHFGGGIAISGNTIVVGKAQDYCCNPQLGEAYVFVKPSGGWSGNLQEQARLSNPQEADDLILVRVGVGGDTVVAEFSGLPGQSANYLNVFVKPSGGWSGALSPTATLAHSDGSIPGSFAVNSAGDEVVVATPFGEASADSAAAYVFLQPSGGWTGAVNESAKLTESDGLSDNQFANAVAVNGDTVVLGNDVVFSDQTDCKCELNGAYIYVKPQSGWSGSLQENQKLIVSGALGIDYGNSVALSNDLVLVGAPSGGSSGGSVYASAKISGDFAIEDVAPVTMATDSSATPTVTVDSLTDYLGTFSNPVALTVTGAPTGVTASLSPASVTPPANSSSDSTLVVQAGPSVTPQSFQLTLTGTYSALTHSKAVSVTIAATIGGTTTVIGTEQALGCIDNSGIANALTSKLAQAQQFINAGNIQAAINTLTALLNQLYAQQGKHIKTSCTDSNGNTFDPDQVLIADVQALLASLGAASIKPNPVMGYTLNASGIGVAGTLVTILDTGKNVLASAKTDSTGFYYFAQTKMLVNGARYTLKVSPPKPYKSGTAPSFTWTNTMITLNSTVN